MEKKRQQSKQQKQQMNHQKVQVQKANETSENQEKCKELSDLTKKFVQLIKNSEDATVDLNFAADHLKVQKSKLYKIIYPLEGINLLQKKQTSKVTWLGRKQVIQIESQIDKSKKRLKKMKQEQQELDKNIQNINKLIKSQIQDYQMQKYHRITQQDIKKIYQGMSQGDSSKQLLILSAPKGSTLEVGEEEKSLLLKMDSDGGGKIKIFKFSAKGMIEADQQKKVK